MAFTLPCLVISSSVDWSHVYVAFVSAAAGAAATALALQHLRVLNRYACKGYDWLFVQPGCHVRKEDVQQGVCILDKEAGASTNCRKADPFDPRPRSE